MNLHRPPFEVVAMPGPVPRTRAEVKVDLINHENGYRVPRWYRAWLWHRLIHLP